MSKNNYIEIIKAYNEATPNKVIEVAGYREWFKITLILYVIISIILYIAYPQYQSYLILCGAICVLISIYLLVRNTRKKFQQNHKEHSAFLQNNHLFWRGERALLFFAKLKELNIVDKTCNFAEIEKIIDIELESKKFDLLKTPFMVLMLPIFYSLVSEIFKRLPNVYLGLVLIFLITVMIAYENILSMFRVEEVKLKELKLFIIWYQVLDLKE